MKHLLAFAFAAFFAANAAAQSVTWVKHPAATTGEIGGSARFTFTGRVGVAFAQLSIAAQNANGENVSERFTLVSQRIGNAVTGQGAYTEGDYVVEITNLTRADAGAYVFQLAVNGQLVSPASQPATLTVTDREPTIVTQPSDQAVFAGSSVSLSVVAAGANPAYQWHKDGAPISGATSSVHTIPFATLTDAGDYTVAVANSGGTIVSRTAALTVTRAPGRIVNLSVLTELARDESFALGYVVKGTGAKPLLIRAAGPSLAPLGVNSFAPDPKLELFTGTTKHGENDNWAGAATLATLSASVGAFAFTAADSLDAATAHTAASGDNSVRVFSATGSGAVLAEIYDATPSASWTPGTARLANASVLKAIGPGITAGFVIAGEARARVLVRAVGPGLAPLEVAGAAADPMLTLHRAGVRIDGNDNWNANYAPTFAAVAAFALPPGSNDAAVVLSLEPGEYTAQATPRTGSAPGLVLLEIYELP